MDMTKMIIESFELKSEILKHKKSRNEAMWREVGWKWCGMRDSLSGDDLTRFIAAAVAASCPLSEGAMALLKDQEPLAYEVRMILKKHDLVGEYSDD